MGIAKTVLFGCGPVGLGVARYALQHRDVELVGAIDTNKNLIGRDLGEIAGIDRSLDIAISADADAILNQMKPHIIFLTTASSMKVIIPQLKQCLTAGANVVSTCEELAYPYRANPELTDEIDRVAKANGVSVLSTGVNPGFLMDSWPLFMTGVCQQVKHIKAIRIQDASSRRGPFQKKIGAGCTIDEFKNKVTDGTLRHVGIQESIAMIASGLAWELDDITESIEPIMAKAKLKTDFITVEPGLVSGVRQVGRGICNGEELVVLEFEASVGASESYDAVHITGTPNLEVVIKGGTHGDIATAAIVVNSIRRVIDASPGLLTMKDMPMISGQGGST